MMSKSQTHILLRGLDFVLTWGFRFIDRYRHRVSESIIVSKNNASKRSCSIAITSVRIGYIVHIHLFASIEMQMAVSWMVST